MDGNADGYTEKTVSLLQQLIEDTVDFAANQRKGVHGTDEVLLTKLQVGALARVAAVYAVDINATKEQFLHICQLNFEEASINAPRFG